MANKKQIGGSAPSSSSTTFDHLFGPKDPSPVSSSSSTGLFGSIFPPPSTVLGRDSSDRNQGGSAKYGKSDVMTQSSKGTLAGEKGSIYHNDQTMEPCYLSSSLYYGGQENYSPRTRSSESDNSFKKDGRDDDSNGSNPNSASRGNWWQGSLYY